MSITRVAPSPTGMFHLGTARTALFNYLAARASNGSFILRIDDTDLARNKDEYIEIIIDSLSWLELFPDHYFRQSERIQIYQKIAFDLLKAGLAKELENGAIALDTTNIPIPDSFTDTLGGVISITETNKKQIDQMILLRGHCVITCLKSETPGCGSSNKCPYINQPTYQFASVVDDYLMGVDWVIRGIDHLTNTPKQIAIWVSLQVLHWQPEHEEFFGGKPRGKQLPQFTHIGLIHKDKKKLSKRDNAASLLWYKENGYSPLAILNFLLRMGWGCKEDKNQLLSLEEMIEIFPKGQMRASPSNFDQGKLDYYNRLAKK